MTIHDGYAVEGITNGCTLVISHHKEEDELIIKRRMSLCQKHGNIELSHTLL